MNTRNILFLCAAVLMVTPTVPIPAIELDTDAAAKADSMFDLSTYQRLNSLTVSVHWKNTDIQSALDDLAATAEKADPKHSGMKISFTPSSNQQADNRKIEEFVLERVSVFEVLEYLSVRTKHFPEIHANRVILIPGFESRYKGPVTL